MRARRVLAIAWRDLRLVHAGRGWWRLPAIALALLLPVGALPLPSGPPTADTPRASGTIPPELADAIAFRERAQVSLSGTDPVVLRGGRVSTPLRAALDTLPGPSVRVVRSWSERRLPGRSLLVALLAISLLTGPLAESLPGERKRGTLETLLTAGVSRLELCTGKWLAWTGATTAVTGAVALSGMLDGSQEVGLWPLGLAPTAAVAVAFGLWLGRGAADEVAGATRTMRVLPVTAVTLLLGAYALGTVHPALGAAVPLGGGLLVAGDVLSGAAPLAAAWVGAAVAVAALLAATARDLTEVGLRRQRLGDVPGLVAAAALVWWLPVVGPIAWIAAGNPALADALSTPGAQALGGALLALLAGVAWVRSAQPLARPAGLGRDLVLGAVVGGGLSLARPLRDVLAEPAGILGEAAGRLAAGLAPEHLLASVVVVAGQGLLFRGVLQSRIGWLGAAAAWWVVTSPTDPLFGGVVALTLGLLARRSLPAAMLAHLVLSQI